MVWFFWHMIRHWLREMEQSEVQPNVVSYNIVIDAYAKGIFRPRLFFPSFLSMMITYEKMILLCKFFQRGMLVVRRIG